jgi:hypothetical protein
MYVGESMEIEAWLLNDTAKTYENCRVVATLRDDQRDYGNFEIAGQLSAAASMYVGTIRFSIPMVPDRESLHVDACLLNAEGEIINSERFSFEVFTKAEYKKPSKAVYADTDSELLCSLLEVESEPYKDSVDQEGTIVVSSREMYIRHQAGILEKVRRGASALLILNRYDAGPWDIDGTIVQTTKLREIYTLAVHTEHPSISWMKPDDLSYLYHLPNDRIDGISNCYLQGDEIEPLAFAYQANGEPNGKRKLPLVGWKKLGKGRIFFSCIPLSGRLGFNPTLDRFLISILGEKGGDSDCNCTPLLAETSKNAVS